MVNCFPRYFGYFEDKYRLYYLQKESVIRLAYSNDGIEWELPDLNVFDVSAEADRFGIGLNNIVSPPNRKFRIIGGIFHEPDDPDPQPRWKKIMFISREYKKLQWPYLKDWVTTKTIEQRERDTHDYRYFDLFTSPDGVRWQYEADTNVSAVEDDAGEIKGLEEKNCRAVDTNTVCGGDRMAGKRLPGPFKKPPHPAGFPFEEC